jgi:hypothetical protein
MRNHLTRTTPMPRWWIYLVIACFILDDIAAENWIGLAIFVTAGIAFACFFRLRAKHKDNLR